MGSVRRENDDAEFPIFGIWCVGVSAALVVIGIAYVIFRIVRNGIRRNQAQITHMQQQPNQSVPALARRQPTRLRSPELDRVPTYHTAPRPEDIPVARDNAGNYYPVEPPSYIATMSAH